MESDIVNIFTSDYQKCVLKFRETQKNISAQFIEEFDEFIGLKFLYTVNFNYYFKIIDEQKWFLAKIKYGF